MNEINTENYNLYNGDCLVVMKQLIDKGIQLDSICCDPPYLISLMNHKWDSDDGIAGKPDVWKLAYDLLKPGGYLLAFSATRTYHKIATAIERAGFNIRDMLTWNYSSGMPKGLNISKAIDKKKGLERQVIGKGFAGLTQGKEHTIKLSGTTEYDITAPASPEAAEWEGWNTNLAPAMEPVVVAQKPISEATITENVLVHGTGAINIDACRIPRGDELKSQFNAAAPEHINEKSIFRDSLRQSFYYDGSKGGYPKNFIHDGSDEIIEYFEAFSAHEGKNPSRFFYSAKASTAERDEGLNDLPDRSRPTMGSGIGGQPDQDKEAYKNIHISVKPLALMQYLCRLITRPNGLVMDLFMGSGSTGVAALREGFRFIGIEMDPEYFNIAAKRIEHWNYKVEQETIVKEHEQSLETQGLF